VAHALLQPGLTVVSSADPYLLVVDDDHDVREMLVDALSWEGYRSLAARNGHEALGHMRISLPSLVLLDLVMPVMDGWQLAAQMASDVALQRVPYVVISGFADRGPPPGATVVFRKPVRLDHLMPVVDALVRHATP
jgi:CheY-like chemotaxis protein